MKSILTLLFIVNFSAVFSGSNHIVSPIEPRINSSSVAPPKADENFFLWRRDSGCYTSNYTVEPETLVSISGTDVRVFFRDGLGGDTICVSPPPPIYLARAEIDGLEVGTYTLSTYQIPFADVFPPVVADYPIYLTDSFQFGVIAPPAAVNATTYFGLMVLTLLLLATVFKSQPERFRPSKKTKPTSIN